MVNNLYSFGYENKSFYDFKELVHDAYIIDVRFMPNSYVAFWKQKFLQQDFKDDYVHIKELGNINYNNKKQIKINDIEVGTKKLLELLEKKDCVMLCKCLDYNVCHQKVIGDYLKEKHEIEVTRL